MGCASSKRVEATAAPYRPAPTSFAVFDINAIEEPWLKHLNNSTTPFPQEKTTRTHVPAPILHKLNMLESTEAPQPWDEVSKALEELKTVAKPQSTLPPPPPQQQSQPQPQPQPQSRDTQPVPRKRVSFHTVEELDAKLASKPKPEPEPENKPEFRDAVGKNITAKPKPEPRPEKPELKKVVEKIINMSNSQLASPPAVEEEGGLRIKPVKENIFIVRDRLERQKEEKESSYDRLRRDPLSQFPEKCPPGGSDAVVLYTTSLGGVRKTFEDCNRARDLLEGHRVVLDERDVSLHGEFLRELKEMVGEEGVALPRVFVKGRYVGGLSELVELNESGRLGRILNATRVERGIGRQACGGCGGARFVPCLECGGSCKIGADKERCLKCNENGLVHCPACILINICV